MAPLMAVAPRVAVTRPARARVVQGDGDDGAAADAEATPVAGTSTAIVRTRGATAGRGRNRQESPYFTRLFSEATCF